MPSVKRTAGSVGVLGAAGMAAILVAGPLLTTGADHLDAPSAKADHQIDITDVYAFRTGPQTSTLVLNVDGLMSPTDSKTAVFKSRALYELKIDTDGDAVADIAYRWRFGGTTTNSDGTKNQNYLVRRAVGDAARRNEWSGNLVAAGRTTPYKYAPRIASVDGGGKAFAGTRDDPFFFDLTGFIQFKTELLNGNTTLGSPGGGAGSLLGGFTGTDTFAGTNVLSMAINVPNSKIGGTGHTVGVWGATSVARSWGWQQLDRMGRPAINTVFNGTHTPLTSTLNNNEKEAFNHINPSSDRAVATDNVKAVMGLINGVLAANSATTFTDPEIAALANTLLPDILTVKLGDIAGFLNGRRLSNDVINAEFSLLTKGAITSDGVDANDKAFLSTFPYEAAPH
jgi:hypothetical protein